MATETLTIPRSLAQMGDMVLIPQKTYEELLRIHRKYALFYERLDKDLAKSLASYRRGKAIGPFASVADLKKSLEQ